MRKLAYSIAAFAALAAASPAAAEAWRVAASSDLAVMLVETDSVEVRGNIMYATVMTVVRPNRVGDWDQSIIRREIDCGRRTSAMMARRFLDRGRLVESQNDRLEPAVHAPDSMMGGVLAAVCGQRDYASGVVSDPYAYGWSLLNAATSPRKRLQEKRAA